jgi:hypothetical protein
MFLQARLGGRRQRKKGPMTGERGDVRGGGTVEQA